VGKAVNQKKLFNSVNDTVEKINNDDQLKDELDNLDANLTDLTDSKVSPIWKINTSTTIINSLSDKLKIKILELFTDINTYENRTITDDQLSQLNEKI
jgi:hypothetical protein